MAEEFFVARAEMRGRLEAAGHCNAGNRHAGLQQQLARPVEAQLAIVAPRIAVEMLAEQPLEVAAREADALGDSVEAERLVDMLFHERGGVDDLLLSGADASKQGHPLPVQRFPDA